MLAKWSLPTCFTYYVLSGFNFCLNIIIKIYVYAAYGHVFQRRWSSNKVWAATSDNLGWNLRHREIVSQAVQIPNSFQTSLNSSASFRKLITCYLETASFRRAISISVNFRNSSNPGQTLIMCSVVFCAYHKHRNT